MSNAKVVNVDGTRVVAYRLSGQGPVIVLVNGTAALDVQWGTGDRARQKALPFVVRCSRHGLAALILRTATELPESFQGLPHQRVRQLPGHQLTSQCC
jgi:hypothetical protein